jgi:hypothetical protein
MHEFRFCAQMFLKVDRQYCAKRRASLGPADILLDLLSWTVM